MDLNHEYMNETASGTFSVKLAVFRNFLFFKSVIPNSVYLSDTLRGCIRFSWCICMYNRDNYIGSSPSIEPIWMVCTETAMSACDVRSIIILGLQLFVLNKVSLVNLEHEEIIFAV